MSHPVAVGNVHVGYARDFVPDREYLAAEACLGLSRDPSDERVPYRASTCWSNSAHSVWNVDLGVETTQASWTTWVQLRVEDQPRSITGLASGVKGGVELQGPQGFSMRVEIAIVAWAPEQFFVDVTEHVTSRLGLEIVPHRLVVYSWTDASVGALRGEVRAGIGVELRHLLRERQMPDTIDPPPEDARRASLP